MFSCRLSYNVRPKCVIDINHKVLSLHLHQCSCLSLLHRLPSMYVALTLSHYSCVCQRFHSIFIVFIMWGGQQCVFDFTCLLFQIFILLSAGIFTSTATLTETLTTHLIVSCPDGKPTEEAAKGRGRGFGGMNSMNLELM